MSEAHFFGKVTLKAIITQEHRILLCRGPQDGDLWDMPGGRLHEDELPHEALRREIEEELGVDAVIGRVVHVEQFHQTNDGSLHLLIAFEAKLVDPQKPFALPTAEMSEVRWITNGELHDQKIYGNLLKALEAYWA